MNETARSELEQLKRKHAQLEQELVLLARQMNALELRLAVPHSPRIPAQPGPEPGWPTKHEMSAPPAVAEIRQPAAPSPAASPPIPPRISSPTQPRLEPKEPAAKFPAPGRPPERSFEMRLGTYWFVRIGIVMVLTGLVLFGNFAYRNFIVHIGPAGKVSLLYLASAVLLGAGAWWQRKAASQSLRNYAQVLFAGGLAAVYFTTYAAHHVDNLRVIDSAFLDGALLLVWAGFMVWLADRKKSEVLALFAVGLAYYTCVITRVGSFTLYSNLVLTVAAVFFLIRNRWAALSFASLVATYAAYGFWRFYDGGNWHWATPEQGLWHGTYFLICYWVVFTAAVFLSKHEALAGPNRVTFLTMNNGEFFAMFLLTMILVRQGGFWKFELLYGAVLIGLAELARRVLGREPLAANGYLTQGLLLVTIGLITKFAGFKLALILGAESVVLLTLGLVRKSLVLQVGAYLAGAMAVGWGIDSLQRNDLSGLYLGATLGALMAFNAFWSHWEDRAGNGDRGRPSTIEDPKQPSPPSLSHPMGEGGRRSGRGDGTLLRPVPAFFTILALASWLATTWYNTNAAHFPLALAVEALALTLSIYVLRLPEFAVLGQGYLLLGQSAWVVHFAQPGFVPPWWNSALMIVITLGLSHWWQCQQILAKGTQLGRFWQGLYALAIVGVTYYWLEPLVSASGWLGCTSLLAVAITAYGVATRAWLLAACGQIFLLISSGQFVLQLWQKKPEWYYPLVPVAALGLLSFWAVKWFQKRSDADESVRGPVLQLALVYRWLAVGMSLWWVWEYIPARERIWVPALVGLLVFLWAGWRRSSEALLLSAAFTVFGFCLLWVPLHGASTVYWPNLVVILALLGQQRLAKRLPERFPLDSRVHAAVIAVGGLSLWLLLFRWLDESASSLYLTASWAALALVLFACGIFVRERVYRWVALGVLATALGRVFVFDIWKLDTIYRILSFMALGIVLLVLGFIYNKYQEKIREWL